jgi:hypothetical protein
VGIFICRIHRDVLEADGAAHQLSQKKIEIIGYPTTPLIKPAQSLHCCAKMSGFESNHLDLAALSTDAAISDIDRNNTKRSSLDGKNPRRRQKSAASASTALTTSARPPIRRAAATQRSSACFNKPVPMPLPVQARSVASCPSNKQGTGSGG